MKPRNIIITGSGILLIYWALLYFSVPKDPYSLQNNITIPIDVFFFGENHIYHGFGIPFDPEGLLSTLPSIVNVLIGYLIGGLIKTTEAKKLLGKLALYGIILIALGLLWDLVFPINKPIWTSSYVLYTCGNAILLFMILIWLIDIKGYKKWSSFFLVFGVNPLFIYALSGIWVKTLIYLMKFTDNSGETVNGYKALYEQVFVPIAGNMNGSLLFGLSHIVFFWFIGWILYKKKIFIKV